MICHMSSQICPLITKPTRVVKSLQTCIDHIYINISSVPIDTGIIKHDLTNHYPIVFFTMNLIARFLNPTQLYTEILKMLIMKNSVQN